MNNPGVYTLAAIDFKGVSGAPQTVQANLAGALSVTLDFDFKYGSGGTSGHVTVQTSFDNGTTWRDVARFDFATASIVKHCNIEFLLSKGVTSYADLAAEGVYDGVMGDQLRAVPSWTGTYANTALALRASVR